MTTATLANATRVNPLADKRWAEGAMCFDCKGDGRHVVSIEGDVIEGTCTRCLGTGRIAWARETCWCGGKPVYTRVCDEAESLRRGRNWFKAVLGECDICKGTGTTPTHLVLVSGECELCKGLRVVVEAQAHRTHRTPSPPCPTCHATGHALIDPHGLPTWDRDNPQGEGEWLASVESAGFVKHHGAPKYSVGVTGQTSIQELAVLYASIARLPDCIIHIALLSPESVARMREWVKGAATSVAQKIREPSSLRYTPDFAWPLTNIVYWTPGADGQLKLLEEC